jgi:hypothetical protein
LCSCPLASAPTRPYNHAHSSKSGRFLADTLDHNTINIWRAVSTVPLQASNSKKIAENVTVAAFKNDELCGFLENGVRDIDIIKAVEKSFSSVKSNFDTEWRGNFGQCCA